MKHAPSQSIKFEHWFDFKEEKWRGRFTHTERRCGKQYGSPVRICIETRKHASHDEFMKQARKKVAQDIEVFWT